MEPVIRYAIFTYEELINDSEETISFNYERFILKVHEDAPSFDSKKECYDYLEELMNDYKTKKINLKVRFAVLPVYCFSDDDIFGY